MAVGNYSVVNPHVDQPLPDSHSVSVRVNFLVISQHLFRLRF